MTQPGSRKQSILRVVGWNLAAFVAFLVLVELGSYAVLKIYDAVHEPSAAAREANAAKDAPGTPRFITDPQIEADHVAYKKVNFEFESFRMFDSAPFKSKYVNVGNDTARLNGNHIDKHVDRTYTIWMLGASPLFGDPADADNETVPAALERILNKRYPGVLVRVRNYGVNGYTTWQELLKLQALMTRSRPDMIVTVDGYNDYLKIFLGDMLQETHTHEQLAYYWRMHVNEGVVNTRMLLNHFVKAFRNTGELLRKIRKFFVLRNARKDVAAWKRRYAELAGRTRRTIARRLPVGIDLLRRNLLAMVSIARDEGIAMVLVHQAALVPSTKRLIGREKTERFNIEVRRFALTAAELDALKEIPSYRVDQQNLWPLDLFKSGYRHQARVVERLARTHGLGYVDAQPLVDAHDMPVFWDSIHLTAGANEVMAKAVADEIATMNIPDLGGAAGSVPSSAVAR